MPACTLLYHPSRRRASRNTSGAERSALPCHGGHGHAQQPRRPTRWRSARRSAMPTGPVSISSKFIPFMLHQTLRLPGILPGTHLHIVSFRNSRSDGLREAVGSHLHGVVETVALRDGVRQVRERHEVAPVTLSAKTRRVSKFHIVLQADANRASSGQERILDAQLLEHGVHQSGLQVADLYQVKWSYRDGERALSLRRDNRGRRRDGSRCGSSGCRGRPAGRRSVCPRGWTTRTAARTAPQKPRIMATRMPMPSKVIHRA